MLEELDFEISEVSQEPREHRRSLNLVVAKCPRSAVKAKIILQRLFGEKR